MTTQEQKTQVAWAFTQHEARISAGVPVNESLNLLENEICEIIDGVSEHPKTED